MRAEVEEGWGGGSEAGGRGGEDGGGVSKE